MMAHRESCWSMRKTSETSLTTIYEHEHRAVPITVLAIAWRRVETPMSFSFIGIFADIYIA